MTLSKSKEKERERGNVNFKIGKERGKIAIWGKISWQAKKRGGGGGGLALKEGPEFDFEQ